jgi:hypothetical protein
MWNLQTRSLRPGEGLAVWPRALAARVGDIYAALDRRGGGAPPDFLIHTCMHAGSPPEQPPQGPAHSTPPQIFWVLLGQPKE